MRSSQVPHRIRDILAKSADRRTPGERKRLEAWERRMARVHLVELERQLQTLSTTVAEAGGVAWPYHDPRLPVFSRECRQGRPEECRWYPCCNDRHTDPARSFAHLRRVADRRASYPRAS